MSGDMDRRNLDAAAAAAKRGADEAAFAAAGISRAVQTGDTSKLRDAFLNAKNASESADKAVTLLLALGAARPGPAVARDALRLEQLDTPAARRLLEALEEAAEAGAALDRERGWVDAEGEPVGHGETLAGMAHLLRVEIFGPAGRE